MRWPKYAAFIFLRYYVSKSNPEETFVTVNYAGQVSAEKIHRNVHVIVVDHDSLLATNLAQL